jgi:hypothetical protein
VDLVVLTKYWLPTAAATAVSIGLAAPAHALSDQQHKFVTAVVNHGGPSMNQMITPAVMETGKTLGDAVCADLHQGNAVLLAISGVAAGGAQARHQHRIRSARAGDRRQV